MLNTLLASLRQQQTGIEEEEEEDDQSVCIVKVIADRGKRRKLYIKENFIFLNNGNVTDCCISGIYVLHCKSSKCVAKYTYQ